MVILSPLQRMPSNGGSGCSADPLIITRTWNFVDDCGNSTAISQTITVIDDMAPVITLDDPLLDGLSDGDTLFVQCYGIDPAWDLPDFSITSIIADDNCDGDIVVTYEEELLSVGDCPVDGYIRLFQHNWSATDGCGNASNVSIVMMLVDTIPPQIVGVPADVTVACDAVPDAPLVYATDECLCASIEMEEVLIGDPACVDGADLLRIWTAKDCCGNMTIDTQTITLIDERGPVIILTDPNIAGVGNGESIHFDCHDGAFPDWVFDINVNSAIAVDACSTTSDLEFDLDYNPTADCDVQGFRERVTLTWKATDGCGNVSTYIIYADMIDNVPPVMYLVEDGTCIDYIGQPTISYADDACGPAMLFYEDVIQEGSCGKEVIRYFEAMDECGNMSFGEVLLYLSDGEGPEIEIVNEELAQLMGDTLIIGCEGQENGNFTPFGITDITASDDCLEGLMIDFEEVILDEGTCAIDGYLYHLMLTWTAVDRCGNVSFIEIPTFVLDTEDPSVEAYPDTLHIECGDDIPFPVFSDNCGDVQIAIENEIESGSCAGNQTIVRTITASDGCGNEIEVTQTIIMTDTQAPVFENVPATICADAPIQPVFAWDACMGVYLYDVSMEQVIDSTSCENTILLKRIYSVSDECGNTAVAEQLVIENDGTPPDLHITDDLLAGLIDQGQDTVIVYASDPALMEPISAWDYKTVVGIDECDILVFAQYTYDEQDLNCEVTGYSQRRYYYWSLTDACGNAAEVDMTILLIDDVDPVLHDIPADTLYACTTVPGPANVTATDNSGSVTLTFDEVTIDILDNSYSLLRTWTAVDACGNTAEHSQRINVITDTDLDCQIDVPDIVYCDSHNVTLTSIINGGFGNLTYLWTVLYGDCIIESGQTTPTISIYVGFTEVSIQLQVWDEYGCTTTCEVSITCTDMFT